MKPITSVRVESVGAHAEVTVFVNHTSAGTLLMRVEEAEEFQAEVERAEAIEEAARWYTDVCEVDELGDLRMALGDPPPGYVSAHLRAEQVEAAAEEADRTYVAGVESEDADGIWQTAEWVAFTAAMTSLGAALAPAPEGSDE